MTDNKRRTAAKQFIANWRRRGDEKQETQAFWMELLQKVYSVEHPHSRHDGEQVRLGTDETVPETGGMGIVGEERFAAVLKHKENNKQRFFRNGFLSAGIRKSDHCQRD